MSKKKRKTLNVLVLNPFINGKQTAKGITKEGNLNMLTLPMREVYNVNEDPDGEHGINPLIGNNFRSIIIDLQRLKDYPERVESIATMLFVIGAEKNLKHMKIAFLGNEELIKNNFEILEENIQFLKSLSDTAKNIKLVQLGESNWK